MDYLISRRLSSDHLYAYSKKRFWFWDERRCVWTESHLMSQKYEREHTARPTLTPEDFMTDLTKFQQLDESELDSAMLDALKDAKPCKTAPIEPVKEERPTPSAQRLDAATAAESQTVASPAVPEVSSPTTETAPAAQNAAAPVSASEKNAALFAGSDSALSSPAAPTFDFGADDQTNALLLQDAQTFITGNMARIMAAKHAHDLTANHYQGSWGKWCTAVGISRDTGDNMVRVAEQFGNIELEGKSILDVQPLKLLYAAAKPSTPENVKQAVFSGDIRSFKEYQELMVQLKAEKARADTAEHQLEAAQADVAGLHEQNDHLQRSYDYANEAYKTADAQRKQAENERDKAQQRARNAEEALKKQPVTTVVDEDEVQRRAKALARQWSEEEIGRQAAEKAWGLADARNAELQADKDKLAKDNAAMQKQLKSQIRQLNAMRSQLNDLAQADFEIANNFPVQLWAAWNASKGSYSHLSGDDLEDTFKAICSALDGVKEEAARLCRQPADYDGGADDEPDVRSRS